MSAGVKGFGPVVAALTIGAVMVLALAACGGKSTPGATTAASTSPSTSTAATLPTTLPATASSRPTTCSSWGKSFATSFNKGAKAQNNPERMLSVCCAPQNAKGVSHCVLELTLVGTTSHGCELVDLGPAGSPVSVGRRIACVPKA